MPVAPPVNSVHPETRAVWREWLAENYTRKEGLWLILWKSASGRRQLGYAEVVEEALCFGWIDSSANTLDADRSMLWLSPRRAGSKWSAVNKARVEIQIAAGRMTAAGRAKIEAAKADGSWNALDAVDALIIPPDLAAAFESLPPAGENFEKFPRSVKRGILEWIGSAKTDGTRGKRVSETARLAAINERANQWQK